MFLFYPEGSVRFVVMTHSESTNRILLVTHLENAGYENAWCTTTKD